jgi:hypothetical protein
MYNQNINKIANEILNTFTITIAKLFNHPISKIAMTAAELLKRTNRKSIEYTSGCSAVSKKNEPAKGRWTFSVKCHEPWSKGPYDVRFKLKNDKLKNNKLKTKIKINNILDKEIQVSCNCDAWKYNGSDFNAIHNDYSERQYSNGAAPNKKDRQRNNLICKHIAACVPLFKSFIIPKEFK